MKLRIKNIKWEGNTNTRYGPKYNWKVIAEADGKEYAFTLWKSASLQSVKIGDEIEGELGSYNDKYGTYTFKLKNSTAPKKTVSSVTDKDIRISLLSLLSSGVNLEAKKKEPDIGAVYQFVEQGKSVIYDDKYILFCTPEQRKAIVSKYKSASEAEYMAYAKYGKPYLHLLTYEEAKEMLDEKTA